MIRRRGWTGRASRVARENRPHGVRPVSPPVVDEAGRDPRPAGLVAALQLTELAAAWATLPRAELAARVVEDLRRVLLSELVCLVVERGPGELELVTSSHAESRVHVERLEAALRGVMPASDFAAASGLRLHSDALQGKASIRTLAAAAGREGFPDESERQLIAIASRLSLAADAHVEERALRDRAVEDLALSSAELTGANEELTQYASIVSHDLKTPLRAIQLHADFIQLDAAGTLSPSTTRHLELLGASVRRAESLADGLLELCGIGTAKLAPRPARLREVALEALRTASLDADVQATVAADWPTIVTEPALLRQALHHLVVNAAKFNRSLPRTVHLRAVLTASGIAILVEDNGIGIDAAHLVQIWRIFERLHPIADFAGTGLGLAVVRKAVTRLGGRVAVESGPDRGTTFAIHLPLVLGGEPATSAR